MIYKNLRGSPLSVSGLCLGCMNLQDRSQAYKLLDTAYDQGINFFDTADVYGDSEAILGAWVKSRQLRTKIAVATKVGFRLPVEGATRLDIIRAADESLRRLGADYIDLYQIHIENESLLEEEVLSALDDLKKAGKVLIYGVSNYTAARLVLSSCISRVRSFAGYSCFQGQYNLVERSLEREHIPILRRENIGLLAWSPLAKGFLAGGYDRLRRPASNDPRRSIWDRYDSMDKWRLLGVLLELADELAVHPAVLALAWVIARPTLCSVVFGASSSSQIRTNCAAGGLILSSDVMERLEEAGGFIPGYPYEGISRFNGRQ